MLKKSQIDNVSRLEKYAFTYMLAKQMRMSSEEPERGVINRYKIN